MEKLKIEDLKKDLFIGDFGDQLEEYSNGYIADAINEIVDNNIDIYTYDLFDWLSKDYNYTYVEQANAEFGIPADGTDLIAQIRQGQFIAIDNNLYKNLENSLINWIYKYIQDIYKIEEITEEQNENILTLNYNNFETFTEIIDEIENIFENIEE